MLTVLQAPEGVSRVLGSEGTLWLVGADGRVTVDTSQVSTLLSAGFLPVTIASGAALDSPVLSGTPTLEAGAELLNEQEDYEGTSSHQPVAIDLPLGADAGNTEDNPKFLAPIMGNVLGDTMTKAGAYLAGVIGALSVLGTKVSKWPVAAVLGVIMDGVTDADGAVVAHLDGDSSVTRAGAFFKAMMRNSVPGSGVDYGVDLYDAGFGAYGVPAIAKALFRSPSRVCILEGAGAPTNGVTGDNFAGKGSLYIDTTNGTLYQNTGAIDNPTWTAR